MVSNSAIVNVLGRLSLVLSWVDPKIMMNLTGPASY